MNGRDLFEAMGNIDEKYMQDLDTKGKVIFFRPKVYSAVACVAVAILCGSLIYQSKLGIIDHKPQEVQDSAAVQFGMPGRSIGSSDMAVTYQNQVYKVTAQIALEDAGVNYTDHMIRLGEIGSLENDIVALESSNNVTGYVYYDEVTEQIIIYCTGGDLTPSFIILKK